MAKPDGESHAGEAGAHGRRKRLGFLLAAPLLGLVLTDVGLGLWYRDEQPQNGYPWPPFEIEHHPEFERWVQPDSPLRRNRVRGVFDPELGWTNRPSARGTDADEGATNSLGARGRREYEPEPPEGTLRLLCFGESFTLGSEVADSESWPAQIEALDERIEAINFGVAAYGLDQALLRFRRMRERVRGQVVVIGIQVGGIGRNVARCRTLEFPPATRILVKPRFRLADGELVLVPLPFASEEELLESARSGDLLERISEHEYWRGDEPAIPGSTIARLMAAHRAFKRRDHTLLWEDTAGEPFRTMVALLDTFAREARESGAEEVLLVLFPEARDRKVRRGSGCAYLGPFRAALAEVELDVIDLDREFAKTLRRKEREIMARAHFTAKGNHLVARRVLAWLVRRPGLLTVQGR